MAKTKKCPACGGDGGAWIPTRDMNRARQDPAATDYVECNNCDGTGKVEDKDINPDDAK